MTKNDKIFDNGITTEKPVDVFTVAKFLGKKPSTIRNWVSTNRYGIPYFRLGNKNMFFLSKVVEWCKSL